MKNIDLETFYGRAKSTIEIAAAYVGVPALEAYIMSCRLKPITVFTKEFKVNRLEQWWVDEFGNSFFLENNSVRIVKNDHNIVPNTKISTDLFYGRSIISNLQLSKAVALFGDFIVFYGKDEYFRCFDITNGSKVSPLEINTQDLIDFQRNLKNGYKLPNIEIEMMIKKEFTKYE